jgi:hypothetical protein
MAVVEIGMNAHHPAVMQKPQEDLLVINHHVTKKSSTLVRNSINSLQKLSAYLKALQ